MTTNTSNTRFSFPTILVLRRGAGCAHRGAPPHLEPGGGSELFPGVRRVPEPPGSLRSALHPEALSGLVFRVEPAGGENQRPPRLTSAFRDAQERAGPPYGKAHGHYKNKPKKEWKNIVLEDDGIRNLVNLRSLSDFHYYPPEVIIKMRTQGLDFMVINERTREKKKTRRDQEKHQKNDDDKGGGKQEKHKGKGNKP